MRDQQSPLAARGGRVSPAGQAFPAAQLLRRRAIVHARDAIALDAVNVQDVALRDDRRIELREPDRTTFGVPSLRRAEVLAP